MGAQWVLSFIPALPEGSHCAWPFARHASSAVPSALAAPPGAPLGDVLFLTYSHKDKTDFNANRALGWTVSSDPFYLTF